MSQQPVWDQDWQRYLYTLWDESNKRCYRTHHVEGQGWVFFDWLPAHPDTHRRIDSGNALGQLAGPADLFSREGPTVLGSYTINNPVPYEPLDQSFQVRQRDYFIEGRMFAILFIEAAGTNAVNRVANYNGNVFHLSHLTRVTYGELAHAQVRRFIVVKRRREYCYAVPVFTYGNRATTKPGVRPDEHAIAYSHGYSPQLVVGEQQLQKTSIPVVMNADERPLSAASRIYFGIHHPIQYNVKVKDLGCVHPDFMATFSGYWKMENGHEPEQGLEVTYDPTNHDTE
ncbi:hypothetical protein G6011_02779 [Alternaria panax]|uniref:DUF6590 domain-containing protein n=1 Tax=Alternaria panax TaxID=48097 RepID=A0AAD4I584_9PLEO|nr:hypothetical protein G6011_02779 [Alternaria panax]